MGAGFAEGQGGDSGQVTFCAAFDDVNDRYPWLPQATEQQRGAGECTDLIVDVCPNGTIESIRLEAWSLEDTLRYTGRAEDAHTAAQLAGQPVYAAVPALVRLLERLFDPRHPT
ncbi:hypothetical protein [uncultured Jatrophihabitans sp.]|uniref:hypothetical protein n=1 Tax=uncultured Jatrophihabitans sp. TaxID=1610747 RepID=UPI0035CAFB6B